MYSIHNFEKKVTLQKNFSWQIPNIKSFPSYFARDTLIFKTVLCIKLQSTASLHVSIDILGKSFLMYLFKVENWWSVSLKNSREPP